MVDINFHIRKHYYHKQDGTAPTFEKSYWSFTSTFYVQENFFDQADELFCLTPSRSLASTTIKLGPDDHGQQSLYFHRLSSANAFSATYPKNTFFGTLNASGDNDIRLRGPGNTPTDEAPIVIQNFINWEGWDTADTTFDVFKLEVTNFLANTIVNSRTLTGTAIEPLAHVDDWNVFFFLREKTGFFFDYFVIFWPGGDSNSSEIVTETI